MKKLIVLAFVLAAIAVQAQTKSSVETKALQQELLQKKSVDSMSKRLLDRYSVREQNGVKYIGVMGKVDATFDAASIERIGGKVTSRVGDIVSMRIPLISIAALDNCKGLVKYSVAHPVAPMSDNTRIDTRTDSVQAGLNLPQAFDGSGVLVGITDWGFDYRHPNINAEEERRILRAWDHYKLSGPAPEGFDYGTEYKTYEELCEAQGDTSGLYGYHSHGTHVAGIIGGRGSRPSGTANSKYIGQAPKVNYLLGSWLLDEAAWMDQVSWMYGVAQQEQKRLVINSSWGMYTFSNLDGTSLLSQAIDHYSDSGVVFVTSAGNNGDAKFHLKHVFDTVDTIHTIPDWGEVGQAIICWGTPGKPFSVRLMMFRTAYNDTLYTPFFSTETDIPYYASELVTSTGDTIHYDVMVESANMNDDRPHILFNFDRYNQYKPIISIASAEGSQVDIWNVGNVQNHAGNTGHSFTGNQDLQFPCRAGDNYYQISEPACAHSSIAVAAYQHDTHTDTGVVAGDITYFSSWGPAYGDYQKPDVAAPGWQVVSSVNSRDAASYSTALTLTIDGVRYKWGIMSGTSMSGPAVTGVVALMLQANPNITPSEVKHIITTTARRDAMTGSLLDNDPARLIWGNGKIDAMRCVAAAYDLNGIEEAVANQPQLVVYPNPATNQASVITSTNEPSQLIVYGIDGRVVMQQTIGNEAVLSTSSWPRGVYVMQVKNRVGVRTSKLILR